MFKKLFIILFIVTLLTTGCSTPSADANKAKGDPITQGNPSQSPSQNEPAPKDQFLPDSKDEIRETINYKDAASVAVLVNKQNELPADYVPPDLVEVNVPFTFKEKAEKRMMRQEPAGKLEELFTAAKQNNIILYGVSGYRSYQTQKSLFAYFTKRDGSEEKANQISARPGESEHQTGLAMDVSSQSVNFGLVENFGDTKEYAWLKDNAHKYGFVVRYPKGKETITEYSYEPWHIRYVGKDLATKLYEEKLTYEEYLFFRI